MTTPARQHGAVPAEGGGFRFSVWAPARDTVALQVVADDGTVERTVPLEGDDGWFTATVDDVAAGQRYRYLLDDRHSRPDPASRAQPDGVHGPSALVDPGRAWTATGWSGRPFAELAIYELHVGTFTPEGTFDAAAAHLGPLADLGITAVELMPLAAFAGERNWGYDGVQPYATHSGYGGLAGLQRFVDAAHGHGLAVLLDVVYNHLGPEGSYLADFGPYFTDHYRTPWGAALNFDGPDSWWVRRYFVENALFWLEAAGVDGLRLDAVHAIVDSSAYPLVEEISDAVHRRAAELGRTAVVIAEDAANDGRLSRPSAEGGQGLDGQWNDDLHHALHVAATGETGGYYGDFAGLDDARRCLTDGFAYAGRWSPFRRRVVGRPERADPHRHVVFIQNHDQIGNRAQGDRLTHLVDAETQKAVAGLALLGPGVPLIFQGEEHRETAPFLYFVDHTDPELLAAVRQGRRAEFAGFGWDEVPDPGAEDTFERSRIDHALATKEGHAGVRAFYRTALHLRHRWRDRFGSTVEDVEAELTDSTLVVRRYNGAVLLVVTLDPEHRPDGPGTVDHEVVLDSRAVEFDGPGDEAGPRFLAMEAPP